MGAEEQRSMIEDRAPRRRQDQVAIQACLQPRKATMDWFGDCLMEPRSAVRGPQGVKVTENLQLGSVRNTLSP